MLLMGMKMSLTKKPTNPMTTNPIAVRAATLVNSARPISVRSGERGKRTGSRRAGASLWSLPLRSGLWQLLTRRMLSLANSRRGSTMESTASMAAAGGKARSPSRQRRRGRAREGKGGGKPTGEWCAVWICALDL